jgi:hypothetical protein
MNIVPLQVTTPSYFITSLTEHHATKTYWGSGGIAPRIPDLSTMEVSDQLHALTPLPPRKKPLVPVG